MKDLDFDELDKAVNSLMTGVSGGSETPKAEEDEKTLDITPTLGADDTPSFDKLGAATAEVTNTAVLADAPEESAEIPTPTTISQPAVRHGGRFMDVVHPSSNMKKPTNFVRPVSRQGATIESGVIGRPDVLKPTFPTDSQSQPLKESLKSPVVLPEVDASKEALPVDTWPDPLEIADFNDNDHTPLTSPFLPDTKVEKRPLGNDTSVVAEEEPTPTIDADTHKDKTVDDPKAQLSALPSEAPPSLPEELQGDMMAIEADADVAVSAPKAEQTHPTDEKLLESGIVPETTPPVVPTGSTSIPQQYREEPSTGSQESGGIYDTDSYHQPLAHPAKKKSGWLWVVWIIVILLIGAGAGAAFYFFVV